MRNNIIDNTVFIDYGIEWENAWRKHIQKWVPPEKPSNFLTVQEANKRQDPIMESLISGDLRTTIEHPYLFLGCQYETDNAIDYEEGEEEEEEGEETTIVNERYGSKVEKSNGEWKSWSDEKIIEKYSDDGEDYVYGDSSGYINHAEYSHWPCSVLKDEGNGRYTVRIHQSPLHSDSTETTLWSEKDLPRIFTNYRRESIHFFVKPTSQDHMLEGAFRHHVGIPEGIFPEHWKNLRKPVVV